MDDRTARAIREMEKVQARLEERLQETYKIRDFKVDPVYLDDLFMKITCIEHKQMIEDLKSGKKTVDDILLEKLGKE